MKNDGRARRIPGSLRGKLNPRNRAVIWSFKKFRAVDRSDLLGIPEGEFIAGARRA